MNVILDTNQFSIKNIYFQESIINNVIENSNFIRILYSNDFFVLNGIYLKINFENVTIDKHYNKYKCICNVKENNKIISYMKMLETSIMKKSGIYKIPQFKLSEQLSTGFIKIINEDENINPNNYKSMLLKISGIWESDREYGITFKFFEIN